jgi:hypothetical protein
MSHPLAQREQGYQEGMRGIERKQMFPEETRDIKRGQRVSKGK